MGEGKTFIANNEALAGTPRFAGELGEGIDAHRVDGKADRFVALIESRAFTRECIGCSMHSALSLPVVTCSTFSLTRLVPVRRQTRAAINACVEAANADLKAFVWTKAQMT